MDKRPVPRDGEGRVRYRAFGFEIATDIEFSQLSPSADPQNAAPADVVFRFGTWEEVDAAGPAVLRLAVPSLGFAARDGREIVVAVRESNVDPQCLERLVLANALNAIAFQRGLVPLHANACRVGNAAVLLCGAKGAGKSTMAAALARAGHALLSDDLAVLHPAPGGGPPMIWPGGAAVKLAESAFVQFPEAPCLQPPVDWDPKALVRLGTAPDGTPVPLRGICLLDWGDAAVRRLDRLEAATLLPAVIRRPHWQADCQRRAGLNQFWLETVAKAPVYRMNVIREFAALPRAIDNIIRLL